MSSINSSKHEIIQLLKSKIARFNISSEFFKNSQFQGWAIIIVLNIILAFLLTPDIHFSHPEYKIGSIATRDVKADRDFLVEDRISSEQRRNETIKDIRPVYDYDSDISSSIIANLTKAFTIMAHSSTQRSQIKKAFEDALGVILTEDEFSILHNKPSISEKIAKIIIAIYNSELITNVTFLKHDTDNGIIIRDIKTQKERDERNLNSIRHVNNIDNVLSRKASVVLSADEQDIRRLLITLSKKLIQPNLTFNKNASERKKLIALNDVKPVFFQVQKDEMIVREGQKITIMDMDKLDVIFKMKGEKRISNLSIFLGMFFMITTLAIILYFPTRNWLKFERKVHDILFLSVAMLLQVILVKIGIFMSEAVNRAFPFLSTEACFYAIPFAIGSMLVGVLINQNVALIFSIFASFLVTFLFDGKIHITLFAFLGCVVASYQIVHYKKRLSFLIIGLILGLVNCAAIIFISLIQGNIASF